MKSDRLPKRGEIWIADFSFRFSDLHLGEEDFTVESEIKKNRPCIIISNNIYNSYSNRVFVVPLTSENTTELEEFFEVLINADKVNKLSKDSKALVALTSYLKEVRLKRPIGYASKEVVEKIVKKLIRLVSNF